MKDNRYILVVDDDPKIRKLLQTSLEQAGFEVATAEDGLDALAMTDLRVPDLILLDILMPRMDGYTTSIKLKANKRTKLTPVVFLSAVEHQLNEQLARQVGADGYLTKPFKLEDLLQTVAEYTKPK